MKNLSEDERSQLFRNAESAANGDPTPLEDFFELGFHKYYEEAKFVDVGPNDPKPPEMQLARDVIQAYWGNPGLIETPQLKGENGKFIAFIMIIFRGSHQDDHPDNAPLFFIK